MNCPACAHENRPGAKFCEECATALKLACASCGAELRPTARFCDECAAPTGTPARPAASPRASAPVDARKVVSIVFADLVGSTALHERLEPESARRFMESYYDAMRGAVESHGGTVTQLLGDGVKAVFGIPRVAEDDAIRAVRAAVAMQEAFRALADARREAVGATGLRVAVNTGEVVANDATEIIGDPVNVAARLQEQGSDGDVVIGESTHRLVSTLVTLELLGSFALKGRSEAVKAYRVVSLDRPAGPATAPFVGRDEEWSRLSAVYETALEKPAACLAVLVGSPGLGKSRLIDEFARRHAGAATVVRAHCNAAGGTTFAPLADAFRRLLGIESGVSVETLREAIESVLPAEAADRARIANGIAALLAGAPPSPEETFFVVRRLLGALAHAKPVVLVIDDLHWAESLLLDLVEHLIQWGSGTALFVLIGARPELRDLRSSLVTPGGLVADVVTLAGLDAGAAMRLAANVIGASDLPAAIAAKVLATSEGNPLFVSELVRMLVQEGALTREGTRWTVSADLSALEMPPTIHALLAARIERLRPEERTVLERAAVVGRHFSRSAVAALMPHESSQLDSRLEALRRSELIERDTGWLLGEPVLRFHHVLIRDAAYRRLLKGTRAELHAKLADWIEAQTGDAPEHDETIGWHLEQAHAFLRELGPLDESGKRLGERAATRLAAAGRRALAGDDVPLAAGLLGRAIERLDAEDPGRADLALDWCEALLSAGDVVPAAAAIAALGRFAASDDRLRAWQTCFASQLTVLTAPQDLQAAADAVAAAAQQLTLQGDATGEAKAHSVHAQALARLGKVGACEAALDLALAAARRAGDRRRANAVLAGAPLAALWGPSPVTRASGRCLDVVRVLRITQGAPAVESVALSCQGVLEALRGRTDAARRMIASSRKMVEELGIASRLFEADAFAGRIEAMEGDTAAAERLLRGAYEGLRDLGLGIDAARAGALLARVLLAQDRGVEAELLTHESEALAGDDLQAAIAWRGVRAESLAKRGEHAAATTLAQAAVAIASATDALLDHADARMALAAALRAAGHGTEADAEERHARELWEAKGATLLAERAAHAQAPVEPQVAAPAAPAAMPARARRVHANTATAVAARADAAFAAGDLDAFGALLAPSLDFVDHPVGATYGHAQAMAGIRAQLRAREPRWHQEPIATLGNRLGLFRNSVSARATVGTHFDVGASETTDLTLCETDDAGATMQRIEVYGEDKLGDAVVRLYECHAELLPEGPERERSAATARAFDAMLLAPAVSDRIATIIAPDFESVDHRHLSLWSMRGGDAFLDHMRALHQVAADVVIAVSDVLAIGPAAVLIRRMHSGTDRVGGGAYERPFLVLFATDATGRLARAEWFDADREAEALARFDALSADAAPTPAVRRRVRANEACAVVARFEAAFTARDATAWEAEFDESLAVIAHPTGASYGRDGHLRSLLRLAQSRDPVLHFEPIATLGESLVLAHRRVAASGATSARYDVGAYEREEFVLTEIASNGRMIAIEIFASDHLSDALVSLYARYAERLPEGPERRRAAATAGSVAAWSGPADLDRMAATVAPSFECADHRPFHTWSSHGRDEWLQHWRMWLNELIADQRLRDHDVLAIEPSAFLVRRSYEGIGRSDAGEYENRLLVLFAFDADGLLVRVEGFEPEREAEALERFDALTTAHSKPGRVARRVQPNRATAAMARFDAACVARDFDTAVAQHREDFEETDHPTGSRYGLDGGLDGLRRLLRAHDPYLSHEPLATLGEGLLLARRSIGASATAGGRFDVGAWARDEWVVAEADAHERLVASEIFAHDRLGDAVVRLYERYAASQPEGPARTRATAIALGVSILSGPIDLARFALAYAPDVRVVDHRVFATWSSESRAESLDHFRHQLDLAPDFAARIDGVLGIAPGGLVVSITFFGTSLDSGGAFENRLCNVMLFDDDGRMSEVQCFEAEQQAEALAHFEAMFGRAAEPARDPFENAAARVDRLLFERFHARDWPGIEALAAPDLVFDERRRMLRNTCGRDVWLEQFRVLFDVPASRFTTRLLATRGERLSLNLHCFSGEVADGGGPLAMDDHLALHEVDRDGRIVAIVLFDLEDEEAAYSELDARWEAGEAAQHPQASAWVAGFRRAFASRDWDAMSALQAPDQVATDSRLVGWGTLRGAGAWTPTLRELVALAPDVRQRIDHLRVTERGHLWHHAWQGTRDGGEFESLLLLVAELGEDGRERRIDVWEADRLDAALARFAEIAAPVRTDTAAGHFENAASRAWRAVNEAWIARDLERFAAPHAADLRYRDHRRLFELDLDRAGFLDFTRPLLTMRAGDASLDLVATRGERLALMHSVMRMEDETVGPSTIESLMLIEADEDGAITAYDRWDLEDEDAARAEIEARWMTGDGAQHPGPTTFSNFFTDLERRDWDAAGAAYAPDFVGHDHRLVGWGTVHGPIALVRALQEMVSLAPDVRMRSNHQRACARGVINDNIWEGTREGGAFESPFVAVTEHDADGRFVRTDFYDPHHLDRALARFEEIRASERRDPLAAIAKPNLASMAMQRNWAVFDVLDLDAAQAALDASRAHYAPDFVWDDRRPLVGLTGDLDLMLASALERLRMGARQQRTIVGTAGDRVAIGRVLWAGGPADGRFEVEFLVVSEVDEAGLFTAHVFFEPEDTRAAQREAWARWAAIDPVAAPWLALLNDLSDGWEARDMARTRAHFADDVVVEDHRHAGIGRIEGADAYLDSVVALRDLAPDQRIEFGLSWASFHRHGAFLSLRRVGTLPDGGAFESDYAVLLIAEAGRITRYEMFEIAALDEALARFEALRPDPLRAPETAATRIRDRHREAFLARDWDAMRALAGVDFVFDDRGKRALVHGDIESWIASMEFTSQPGFRADLTLIGTLGDRIVLDHCRWFGKPGGDAFEFERVRLLEVGANGLLRAVLFFDPEDRFAASLEGLARFAAGEAGGSAGIAPLVSFVRARFDRSGDALRECLAPDLVFVDQRPLGFGTLDREQWIASLQAGDDLGDGVIMEVYRVLAWSEQGHVAAIRRFGTIADGGGPFEVEAILTGLVVDGRIRRIEVFGEADAERAVARFEELGAQAGS